MALVVVESAAVLALDGPRVGRDGTVVVGDEIGGGEGNRSDLLRDVGVLRLQPDSGHLRERKLERESECGLLLLLQSSLQSE